jgi:hypothetical protein
MAALVLLGGGIPLRQWVLPCQFQYEFATTLVIKEFLNEMMVNHVLYQHLYFGIVGPRQFNPWNYAMQLLSSSKSTSGAPLHFSDCY